MTPPADRPHSLIEVRIAAAMLRHVSTQKLGIVNGSGGGFDLPSGDTVAPDAFIPAAKLHARRGFSVMRRLGGRAICEMYRRVAVTSDVTLCKCVDSQHTSWRSTKAVRTSSLFFTAAGGYTTRPQNQEPR
jgi:hypothetical protein